MIRILIPLSGTIFETLSRYPAEIMLQDEGEKIASFECIFIFPIITAAVPELLKDEILAT